MVDTAIIIAIQEAIADYKQAALKTEKWTPAEFNLLLTRLERLSAAVKILQEIP